MSTAIDSFEQNFGLQQALDEFRAKLDDAATLKQIVLCAFSSALAVAAIIVEQTL